jgi:ribosomal protein S18 acetylase RimI-like enzyme
MSSDEIQFRDGTAAPAEIQAHLKACDDEFFRRLSDKVDVGEYSIKIGSNAKTFEAWSGDSLVGLVAAYMNDSSGRRAFVTNVSVVRAFAGRGIATTLLDRCVTRASQEGMRTIALEVSRDSSEAMRLYEKYGFSKIESRDGIVLMSLTIGGKNL